MSDPQQDISQLVNLAKDSAKESRSLLVQNVADMFLTDEGRLNDRERSLMTDILGKLISEVEMTIRRQLAERFAQLPEAPKDLIVKLANDEVQVARPILLASKLLQDADLIEIVKHRSQEHQLSVAMREQLSETVAQALVEYGDEDVIETLINNHDANLARQTMDYLVEESQRLDRFQEPLLHRPDLPPELAHRMFWWVSATLRRFIVSEFQVDEGQVDQIVQETTNLAARAPTPALSEAEELAESLAAKGRLNERFLIQSLRDGRVSLFVASLACLSKLDTMSMKRIVFDKDGEPLAVAWKAAGLDRASFATAYLLTRQIDPSGKSTDPNRLTQVLALFDEMAEERARVATRYWVRDNYYLTALRDLEQDA